MKAFAIRLPKQAADLQLPVAQYCCILAMAWSLLIAAISASLRCTRVRSRWTRSAGSAPGGGWGAPRSGLIPSWTHAQKVCIDLDRVARVIGVGLDQPARPEPPSSAG